MALTRLKGNQIFDDTITIADLAVTDGNAGQALITDGAGTLSFGDVASANQIPTPDLFAGGTHPGQNTFTLSTDPGSANAVQVWVDDVLQRPATNYTVIGTTLSFTSVPADSADIYVVYEGEALSIGTVADASITSAKLANFSITVDKLAIANFATPETFTGVTNQTTFALAMNPGSAYAIFVYLNTVWQKPGPDYTLSTTSGVTSLVFTTAPAAGDEIYVRYGMQAMPSGISSVGDGTLTIAKFAPSTFLVDSFVVTAPAGQQDFTLTRNPGSVYAMFVVVEGIIQKPLTHYTVSGTTLSFTSVLPVDSEVEVHLNGFPSPLNAPADATVGRTTLLTTNSSASGLVLKVSSNNADLEWGTIETLPTQTSHSGKFLTTDGSVASWSTITHPDEIPSQSGHTGKFLTTDGSVISWATVAQYTLPTQTGQSGKYLTTDGTNESWGIVDALPTQTSHSGKFLTTDGSAASWADVPAVTVSDTPPGSPAHSDLWWDSALGKLKIYYNDGTSSQWVDAHQIGTIDPTMGGDLSGLSSNAQIVANAVGATEIATNAVGITELNVADGTVGQALTTDGAGTLSFGDSGASVTISDTAPGSASAGDLWWKSDTGRLKVYYDDGSGAQWVDAFPVGSSDPAVGGDLIGTASNAQIAANAVGTAEIATDAVTSNEIVANAVGTAEIATDAVTSNEIVAGAVGVTELATTLDLSSNTVTLPAASVTPHLTAHYDDTNLRNDIATLALQSAIISNQAAYNLANAFIDQFEDDTGIDAETDCDRNASEYMSSITGLGGNDAYTKLLLHCNAGGTSSTFVDSSPEVHTITASDAPSNPNQQGSGATIKFGASSGKWNNSSYLSAPDHADWHWGSDDWTIDFWLYHPQHCSTDHFDFIISQPNASGGQSYFGTRRNNAGTYYMMGNSINGAGAGSDSFSITLNEWNHFAICQHGDYQYHYKDGVSVNGVGVGKSSTVAFADLNVPLRIGYQQDVEYYNGWADEIRISKGIARYPSGTTFTPFTTEYGALVTSATGNFTSTTQTASATVSNMGIVVLYKNNAGTTTLNTDLVAKISADGGTNYETVTLSPAGTFSTGIKTAVANSVNMPNTGTAPKYKIEFANQANGSKETQVHGVALLY